MWQKMVELGLIQDAQTTWLGMDHMLFGWINRPKKCKGQFYTSYTPPNCFTHFFSKQLQKVKTTLIQSIFFLSNLN